MPGGGTINNRGCPLCRLLLVENPTQPSTKAFSSFPRSFYRLHQFFSKRSQQKLKQTCCCYRACSFTVYRLSRIQLCSIFKCGLKSTLDLPYIVLALLCLNCCLGHNFSLAFPTHHLPPPSDCSRLRFGLAMNMHTF